MRIIKDIKDIKTGDIILVHSSGFLQDAIQEFQGNKYNHACICVWIGSKLYIFEAIKQGQAFTDINYYLDKQDIGECSLLLLKPKNDEFDINVKYQDFIDFILPLTHKPYGFFNLLVKQPIKFIGKKLGRDWWINGKDKKRAFICGELVAYIYNHFLGWFKDWFKLAPVGLHKSTKFEHFLINIK